MFTGIVQGTAELVRSEKRQGYTRIELKLLSDHLSGLELGASVAVDGVCLTVVSIRDSVIGFDVISNSLKITTLDCANETMLFNYERSMKKDSEIGGHILSGHVDFTGQVVEIQTYENSFGLTLEIAHKWNRYIFDKGFIGLNGASLTVSEIDKSKNQLTVWIIPETLKRTNISCLKVGSLVNIEIDRETQVLVDTISRIAEEKFGTLGRVLELAIQRLGLVEELKIEMDKTLSEVKTIDV